MFYSTNYIDITYQATFKTVAFELAGPGNLVVLRSLFSRLSPRYVVPTEELKSFGGTSMNDVRVQVTIANGQVTFEVTAEKLLINFKNVRTKEDLEVITDLANLGLEALHEALPTVKFREEILRFAAFLQLKGKATNFLSQVIEVRSEHLQKPEHFGAKAAYSGFKIEMENQEAAWFAHFDLIRSWANESALIFTGGVTYQLGSSFESLKEKVAHTEQMADRFLVASGLSSEDEQ